MGPSAKEISNIKSHEGLKLSPYWDNKGYSIGYGHFTGKAAQGDYSSVRNNLAKYGIQFEPGVSTGITTADADKLLNVDIYNITQQINSKLTANLTQTEYDALFDFVYAVGIGNASNVIQLINAGDMIGAGNLIMQWVHLANGSVSDYLVKLRTANANDLTGSNSKQAGLGWVGIGILLLLVLPKILKNK